jgi:hypothetical protein
MGGKDDSMWICMIGIMKEQQHVVDLLSRGIVSGRRSDCIWRRTQPYSSSSASLSSSPSSSSTFYSLEER